MEAESKPQAICNQAMNCAKAPGCRHGHPHEVEDSCTVAGMCYDIVPSQRTWCEIVPASASPAVG